jgi:hypothetical protein
MERCLMSLANLRDNRAELVRTSIAGRIAPPRLFPEAPGIDREGRQVWLPGAGGIVCGVHMGDPAARWLGDHLMPGASIEDVGDEPAAAGPLHLLSCVGNPVRDGAGRRIGVVSGKRGGMAPGFWAPQLVSVELPDSAAEALAPGDRVVVETQGRGLRLLDHPDIALANLAPALLDALPLEGSAGVLTCHVRAIAPAVAAGPGLGQDTWIGDLEIAGDGLVAGSLEDLRFGDLVAFRDIDARTTRFYQPGRVAIGLVSHGPSPSPGHGIGVTLLLTGSDRTLEARMGDQGAVGSLLRLWSEQTGVLAARSDAI